MSRRAQLSLFGILISLLLTPSMAAQSTANPVLGNDQVWDFGFWGGEAIGKTAGQTFGAMQITMAAFHLGRVFHRASPSSGIRRTWEYTFELQPLFLVTGAQHAYGGGFAPIGVKWNFAPRPRYRPFLEFNGGAMFTNKNVPAGNTSSFNFTASLGPGVMVPLGQNRAVSFAARFWHLSNGYTGANNPSVNTMQFTVGYHWLTSRKGSHHEASTAPSTSTEKQ